MVIFTIIGALVGAGFSSGQEIYLFFYRFGILGLVGIVLCSLIIGFIIFKTLNIIFENNIKTYKDFLNCIFDGKTRLAKITNISITIFLGVTFFIMVAGFGTFFAEEMRYK